MKPVSIEVDTYVVDVLMRDLVGHDKMPSAFIVYLYLSVRVEKELRPNITASYGTIAAATGLSKTAVQCAIRRLLDRKLITSSKSGPTAAPVYRLNRHWRRRFKRQ